MSNGVVLNRSEIGPDVEVKLVRQNACRLVVETPDSLPRLYFNNENSLEYHGEEAQFLDLPEFAGPILELLIHAYPEYTKIEDIPSDNDVLLVVKQFTRSISP